VKLNDALKKSEQKHEEAKEKQFQKRTRRPVTTSGLIQYFSDLYYFYGIYQPPLLTKDTRNKVNGFIKLLKNNGYEDHEIWDFIKQVFENWDYFKQQDFYTDNRKKYILAIRPDLKDIIVCKGQFIQELSKEEELECNSNEEKDMYQMWLDMNQQE